jgi:hypothetical protein
MLVELVAGGWKVIRLLLEKKRGKMVRTDSAEIGLSSGGMGLSGVLKYDLWDEDMEKSIKGSSVVGRVDLDGVDEMKKGQDEDEWYSLTESFAC